MNGSISSWVCVNICVPALRVINPARLSLKNSFSVRTEKLHSFPAITSLKIALVSTTFCTYKDTNNKEVNKLFSPSLSMYYLRTAYNIDFKIICAQFHCSFINIMLLIPLMVECDQKMYFFHQMLSFIACKRRNTDIIHRMCTHTQDRTMTVSAQFIHSAS